MDRIEITDYVLAPHGPGCCLPPFNLTVDPGQTLAVHGDKPEEISFFLRALATLEPPVSGSYRFFGQPLDFSDYRRLLPFRRKISYMGRNSALVSNLSIRDNLMLEKAYFGNSRQPPLSEEIGRLCEVFNLSDKLDDRPAALNPLNLKAAIAIRELTKASQIIIMDGPEVLLGHPKFAYFIERIKSMTLDGAPFVFFTEDPGFIKAFAGREISIRSGCMSEKSAVAKEIS